MKMHKKALFSALIFRFGKNGRLKIFVLSLTYFLIFFLFIFVLYPCTAEADSGIRVLVDGEQKEFSVPPVIIEGSTFVPVRELFETLGAEVSWNGERKEVLAEKAEKRIVLKIGSTTAMVNASVQTLNEAPYLSGGHTMIPLRFVSEALDYDVAWNGETCTITIDGTNQDSGQTPDQVLTYDDAISSALDHSDSCKSAELEYRRANQTLKEFQGLYRDVQEFSVWQQRKDLTIYRSWYEKQIALTEEQTAYGVVSDMDQITCKRWEMARKQENIQFLQEKAELEYLKYQLGASSYKEWLTSQNNVTVARQELDAMQTEYDALYTSLNAKLGIKDTERAIPEFQMTYRSVKEENIDELIAKEAENDPYIWYAEQNLDSAEFKLLTYEYNVGGKSHTLTVMDVTEARNNLDAIKTKFDTVMRTRYHSLLQIEDQIDSLMLQYEILCENIDTARIYYDTGAAAKSQLEELLQTQADLKMNIDSLKVTHSMNRVLLEKPYLAPVYVTA